MSRNFQTAGHVYHFKATPATSSATAVLAATGLTASTQTITANITQPDVPRALQVKGNAAGIAGNVVVTGRNADGATISETFALNGSSAVTGSKAFAHVTSIALPVKTNSSGDTVSVGTTDKLGLPFTGSHHAILATFYNHTQEGTAPMVTSGSSVEANTLDLNSALSGSQVDCYIIV